MLLLLSAAITWLVYGLVSVVWGFFGMKLGPIGWSLVGATGFFGALLTLAGSVPWFRHHLRYKEQRLWRNGKIQEALQSATQRRKHEWILASLKSLGRHNAGLRESLHAAVRAVLHLREDATDAKNTYLSPSLKAEAQAQSSAVLTQLYEFAQRLWVLESRGLQAPQEEASRVQASLEKTATQAAEARAGLSKLTFGVAAPQMDKAAQLVKSIAWQAEEMHTLDRQLQ